MAPYHTGVWGFTHPLIYPYPRKRFNCSTSLGRKGKEREAGNPSPSGSPWGQLTFVRYNVVQLYNRGWELPSLYTPILQQSQPGGGEEGVRKRAVGWVMEGAPPQGELHVSAPHPPTIYKLVL